MSARQSREVTLAVSHQQRTGCTPAAAAQRYGVAVSSVRRALARLGVEPQPVGRPVKSSPASNPALNAAPFGRWMPGDKAARRPLALRCASKSAMPLLPLLVLVRCRLRAVLRLYACPIDWPPEKPLRKLRVQLSTSHCFRLLLVLANLQQLRPRCRSTAQTHRPTRLVSLRARSGPQSIFVL